MLYFICCMVYGVHCALCSEQNQCQPSTNDKNMEDEEIARLRGENELLKAILTKHGINYAKERSPFKSEDNLNS